jgi:hypothetical protein
VPGEVTDVFFIPIKLKKYHFSIAFLSVCCQF